MEVLQVYPQADRYTYGTELIHKYQCASRNRFLLYLQTSRFVYEDPTRSHHRHVHRFSLSRFGLGVNTCQRT